MSRLGRVSRTQPEDHSGAAELQQTADQACDAPIPAALQLLLILGIIAAVPVLVLMMVLVGVVVAAALDAPGAVVVLFAAYSPIGFSLTVLVIPWERFRPERWRLPALSQRLRSVAVSMRSSCKIAHMRVPTPAELDAAIEVGLTRMNGDITALHAWSHDQVHRFAVTGDHRRRHLAILLTRRIASRRRSQP